MASNTANAAAVTTDDRLEPGQAPGGRRAAQHGNQLQHGHGHPLPGLTQPSGQLLQGATDAEGKPKAPSLLIGVKLDLEAEVHLSARVKGDVTVGLY